MGIADTGTKQEKAAWNLPQTQPSLGDSGSVPSSPEGQHFPLFHLSGPPNTCPGHQSCWATEKRKRKKNLLMGASWQEEQADLVRAETPHNPTGRTMRRRQMLGSPSISQGVLLNTDWDKCRWSQELNAACFILYLQEQSAAQGIPACCDGLERSTLHVRLSYGMEERKHSHNAVFRRNIFFIRSLTEI